MIWRSIWWWVSVEWWWWWWWWWFGKEYVQDGITWRLFCRRRCDPVPIAVVNWISPSRVRAARTPFPCLVSPETTRHVFLQFYLARDRNNSVDPTELYLSFFFSLSLLPFVQFRVIAAQSRVGISDNNSDLTLPLWPAERWLKKERFAQFSIYSYICIPGFKTSRLFKQNS